jgi:hypothetical protein
MFKHVIPSRKFLRQCKKTLQTIDFSLNFLYNDYVIKDGGPGGVSAPRGPDHEGISFMAKKILARPACFREQRGLEIACEHFDEIAFSYRPRYDEWAGIYRNGTYRVPDSDDALYTVRLAPEEYCSCPNSNHPADPCEHVYAVRTVKAKTTTCCGCGKRFRGRDLVEVADNNLTFFEGDPLCHRCACDHGAL